MTAASIYAGSPQKPLRRALSSLTSLTSSVSSNLNPSKARTRSMLKTALPCSGISIVSEALNRLPFASEKLRSTVFTSATTRMTYWPGGISEALKGYASAPSPSAITSPGFQPLKSAARTGSGSEGSGPNSGLPPRFESSSTKSLPSSGPPLTESAYVI